MRWLLLLAGCSGPAPGDTDACTSDTGTVHVCVAMDEESASGEADGRVWIAAPDDEEGVEHQLDAEGCVSIEREAGTWEVWARDGSGYCVSMREPVEVEACATEAVQIYLVDWCVGR